MDENERRVRVTDEATHWWLLLGTKAASEISRADREAFTRWLRESPLNIAELLRVAHVHDALEHFKLWREVDLQAPASQDNVVSLSDAAVPPRRRDERMTTGTLRWFVAASLLLVVFAGAWWALGNRDQIIRSDRAERRQVALNDGSVVQLEPETTLRVRLQAHARYVLLESGSALFHVAKDPQRPFWVRADQTLVRAVGTAFGVEQRDGRVLVTVAEGTVAVTATRDPRSSDAGLTGTRSVQVGRAAASEPGSAAALSEVILAAGQQVTVPEAGAASPVQAVDPDKALAWAQGRLVFDNDTLAHVLAEFNRYNRTQLIVRDPQLAGRRISGVFDASDPETLLAFIQAGSPVGIIREGTQQVVITPAR